MYDLCNPAVVKDLMRRHGVRFSKGLGQNFLINPTVCPKLAELGGARPGVGALEIGPGAGVLTVELAARCDRVVAVELDGRLLPVLEETTAGFSNVRILHADILGVDLPALLAEQFGGMPVVVCANLPYYVTSPILMALLEARLPAESYTLMVQKEMARRIAAPLPSRQAGALTAAVAYYTEPRILFGVAAGSFLPRPKVDSAVIRLEAREYPPVAVRDEGLLFRVIRGAFAQRRKTLLNALSAAFGADKAKVRELLEAAGVDPGARAEQLSMEQFGAAADAFWELR